MVCRNDGPCRDNITVDSRVRSLASGAAWHRPLGRRYRSEQGRVAMVFRSSFPDVDIPALPAHELIFRGLSEKADRPALIDGISGLTITYGEFATAVDRLAAALAERGIGKGDVIGIFAPNTPAYAITLHGVLRAGAVATTANALYTAEEVASQLADAGAKLLFTVSTFLER